MSVRFRLRSRVVAWVMGRPSAEISLGDEMGSPKSPPGSFSNPGKNRF